MGFWREFCKALPSSEAKALKYGFLGNRLILLALCAILVATPMWMSFGWGGDPDTHFWSHTHRFTGVVTKSSSDNQVSVKPVPALPAEDEAAFTLGFGGDVDVTFRPWSASAPAAPAVGSPITAYCSLSHDGDKQMSDCIDAALDAKYKRSDLLILLAAVPPLLVGIAILVSYVWTWIMMIRFVRASPTTGTRLLRDWLVVGSISAAMVAGLVLWMMLRAGEDSDIDIPAPSPVSIPSGP